MRALQITYNVRTSGFTQVLAYIHVVYMYTRTMYCRFKIKLVVVGGTIAEFCQRAALFASLQMYHLVKNILALTMTEGGSMLRKLEPHCLFGLHRDRDSD